MFGPEVISEDNRSIQVGSQPASIKHDNSARKEVRTLTNQNQDETRNWLLNNKMLFILHSLHFQRNRLLLSQVSGKAGSMEPLSNVLT